MSYGTAVRLDTPFVDALAAVKQALVAQGFGIVSEVDIAATLRAKIGVEIPAQVILGACNPGFANRALQTEPSIGLLLPCNVVVRADGDGSLVEMIDPEMLVEVTGNEELRDMAAEVGQALAASMQSLAAG
jgi:uncharacterized protein (DUF302 family)